MPLNRLAAGLLAVLAILCLTATRTPAEEITMAGVARSASAVAAMRVVEKTTRGEKVFPTQASSISADEMAMLLATLIIAGSSCGLETTDVPLNVAVRRYGFDLVDFLPDGRYAPIVERKARKAREFVQGMGKPAGCQGLVETVQRFLPEIVRK
jgi:hypothetical protein